MLTVCFVPPPYLLTHRSWLEKKLNSVERYLSTNDHRQSMLVWRRMVLRKTALSDFDIDCLTSLAMLGCSLQGYVVGSLKRVFMSTRPCLTPISTSIWANAWNPWHFAMLSGQKSIADIRQFPCSGSATGAFRIVVTLGTADFIMPAVFQLNDSIFWFNLCSFDYWFWLSNITAVFSQSVSAITCL